MGYTWNGAYGTPGAKKAGKGPKNKGVLAARRAEKRAEAEERNRNTAPERRRKARREVEA